MDLRTGLITVLVASGLTVACASRGDAPTAPTNDDRNDSVSGSCDATKAQFAIGERASEELLNRARVAAGARTARFIRPNEPITLEFSTARLNLNLNDKDVVQSVTCG